MSNPFFDRPILNSPYSYPEQHWELDASGQPTQQIVARRRPAEFITAVPQPHKRRGAESVDQLTLTLDEGAGRRVRRCVLRRARCASYAAMAIEHRASPSITRWHPERFCECDSTMHLITWNVRNWQRDVVLNSLATWRDADVLVLSEDGVPKAGDRMVAQLHAFGWKHCVTLAPPYKRGVFIASKTPLLAWTLAPK